MRPGWTEFGQDGFSLRTAARAAKVKIERKILFSGGIVV
jgi:hypothetical protein